MNPLESLVTEGIRARGPMGFDELVELALYHHEHGFYAAGGAAGRRGDFLTSPEVGPLFGAVLARALDAWWDDLGRPRPYVLAEVGAGVGTLWRSVRAARPACAEGLHHLLVERSASLRAGQPEAAESHVDLAALDLAHVVLANELLDNLPFGLRQDEAEVRVALDAGGGLAFAPDLRLGCVPVQDQAAGWLARGLDIVAPGGRVVVLDYATTTADLATRPWDEWLRTYVGHGRGGHPLRELGRQDITVEVCVDQLAAVRPPNLDRTQAEFLRAHGIDELVSQGRRTWADGGAAAADLAALAARSRVGEAEALLDPAGLGAFRVLEWTVG